MTVSHRRSKTPEYAVWAHMRARCNNPDHPAYKNYGGRGIAVWPDWDRTPGGFESFFGHVGPRPSDDHELDRANNDRGYEPGNVRWVLREVNLRNKRTTRMIAAGGRTMCLSEWSRETGLSTALILFRLKAGWTAEDAVGLPPGAGLSRPSASRGREGVRLEAGGRSLTVDEWATERGLKADTIYARLKRGWSAERAVSAELVVAAPREPRPCERCGGPVLSRVKGVRWCSRECFRASCRVERKCLECGCTFQVRRSTKCVGYCSHTCSAIGNGKAKTAKCGPQTWRCALCGGPVSRPEYTRCAGCRGSERVATDVS